MTDEQWRDIPQYEGFYEVSDHHRVRSVDRVIYRSNGMRYTAKGRVLRPALHGRWVRCVTLARAGHTENRCVHLMVRDVFGDAANVTSGSHFDPQQAA
jgi:hypothetical protein